MRSFFLILILFLFKLSIYFRSSNAQVIGFPSGGGSPPRPPVSTPPSSRPRPTPTRRCSSTATCTFLRDCPEIVQAISHDISIIRRNFCARGPRGIHVCCPNRGRPPTPTTTTRRPITRPPRTTTSSPIFFFPQVPTSPPPTENPRAPSSLLPSPPQCGFQTTDDRILGGTPAPIGAYPWVAALGYTNRGGSTITFECAGTVINDRYVITAAHCLDPQELQGRRLVVIHLGDWDLTSPTDCQAASGPRPRCVGPHLEVGFEDTISHPDYNKRGLNSDDIALIRLDQKVNFNAPNRAPISPVCLPNKDFDASASGRNRPSIAVGWGITENGTRSTVLLRVALRFADTQICETRYGNRFVGNQLCVGGQEGLDTCSGDSGGPLILSGPQGPPYLLIGIVSFGPLPCALADNPAVYTEVSKYRSWIEENIKP